MDCIKAIAISIDTTNFESFEKYLDYVKTLGKFMIENEYKEISSGLYISDKNTVTTILFAQRIKKEFQKIKSIKFLLCKEIDTVL